MTFERDLPSLAYVLLENKECLRNVRVREKFKKKKKRPKELEVVDFRK